MQLVNPLIEDTPSLTRIKYGGPEDIFSQKPGLAPGFLLAAASAGADAFTVVKKYNNPL